MYKRITLAALLVIIIGLPTLVPAETTQPAYASTTQEQINFLTEKIRQYTAEITRILGLSAASSTSDASTKPGMRVGYEFTKKRLCDGLTRTLTQGAQGDDVTDIQEFLTEEGFFNTSPTGYFGPKTAEAIMRFQERYGLPGVGVFGPQTRKFFLGRWCGGSLPPVVGTSTASTSPVVCAQIYQPVCGRPAGCSNPCPPGAMCLMACRLYDERTYANRCTLDAAGATFVSEGPCKPKSDTTATSTTPVINSFSGPTTLSVGQTGTWSINATDPSGGTLTYVIDWGDTNMYNKLLQDMAGEDSEVGTQTTTFEHSYSRIGFYTIRIKVKSSNGKSVTTTASVVVTNGSTAGTSTPSATSTGAVFCTQDAKLCPDGSYVGRSGPNCSFAPCPHASALPTVSAGTSTCAYSGKNYAIGYARKEDMECENGCWNSAKMYVCTATGWIKRRCGFSNLIGPFYGGTQYCGEGAAASTSGSTGF